MMQSSRNRAGAVRAVSVWSLHFRAAVGLLLAGTLPLVLVGCGAAGATTEFQTGALGISPATASLDTNCTGCNAVDARGNPVLQLAARTGQGNSAPVTWSVSGGDALAGPGNVDATGRYTPPSFLTRDQVSVQVIGTLAGNPALTARATITLTPGFLQPLTPENVALGPMGTVTMTGRLAQAGGHSDIHFALTSSAQGTPGGGGSLGVPVCQHSEQAFTTCSVTYTAPATVSATGATFVVASVGESKTEAEILLNMAGVNSNPTVHQGALPTMMPLGSSGGNNRDFDARGNTIADCCSGTLGALVQDNAGRQYLLSNNHVLARSDHATVGDAIVQPGLIDNNCTPSGEGPGTVPVAALATWLPLKSSQTNADAAIAQVASRTLDANGSILELGSRQADGSLAAAPPGISSTGGKGEAPALQMTVAKSGRTTGLTCAAISAVDLDVSVDYYRDCAETKPYLTKVYTHQMTVSGDRFSDAGDSGALVVDTTNAEPVGLFFAGGTDAAGVVHGIANPTIDVLTELAAQAGNSANYSFVGGQDHGVSCLNYGDSTISAAQGTSLPAPELARVQQALFAARMLVDPSAGILGVAMGKSSDHPGEAALIVYVSGLNPKVPLTVEGVRTMVIPASMEQVALGTAPLANVLPLLTPLAAADLKHTVDVKERVARSLMRQNPAYFGVGVGQSLDSPHEGALVIYVDRNHTPEGMPPVIDGVRTRYIEMDRLHVTRSYTIVAHGPQHCLPHAGSEPDPETLMRPRLSGLF